MKKSGLMKMVVIVLVVVALSSPVLAGRGGRGRGGRRDNAFVNAKSGAGLPIAGMALRFWD